MNIAHDPRTLRKGLVYTYRALCLRCPTCGERPIFLPFDKVRSLDDWFSPLDGCPNCGYAYDREPGYFLMAIWGVNYGVIGLGVISSYFVLRVATDINPSVLFFVCVVPAPMLSILFARHAKSLFLALDLFFDPHTRIQKNKNNTE